MINEISIVNGEQLKKMLATDNGVHQPTLGENGGHREAICWAVSSTVERYSRVLWSGVVAPRQVVVRDFWGHFSLILRVCFLASFPPRVPSNDYLSLHRFECPLTVNFEIINSFMFIRRPHCGRKKKKLCSEWHDKEGERNRKFLETLQTIAYSDEKCELWKENIKPSTAIK